jgi:amidase
MVKYQLDAILSINNNNSGHAAANYPCLTIPMGLQTTENHGDFIARPYQEDALLKWVLPLKKQPKPENYLTTINRFINNNVY